MRNDEFLSAIEKSRQYILGNAPLCVIITGLDSKHADTITAGVKQLHRMLGRRRQKLPVMVVNVAGYNIMPAHRELDENARCYSSCGPAPRYRSSVGWARPCLIGALPGKVSGPR